MSLGRLPPAGSPYDVATLRRIAGSQATSGSLSKRLALRLGVERIDLMRSGREALRVGLGRAAKATGRNEVIVPAYACFSVAAAAVAAGLRVRLVDVDALGRIDPSALECLPLDHAAAVVVCNLFGRAEPLDQLQALVGAAGAWLVDDAAQAFGAAPPGASGGRTAGSRGDCGILSFGRGKPLSGLGGGALVVHRDAADSMPAPVDAATRGAGEAGSGGGGGAGKTSGKTSALVRALAYDFALHPIVFATLASIPALGIGETPFDPGFERGGIEAASVVLTDVALDAAANDADIRGRDAMRLAKDLLGQTRLEPILAEAGERCVYPRLAVRAPDEATRAGALAIFGRVGAGASPLYPAALSRLEGLRPHRVCNEIMPEAERLAGRLLTLPVHAGLRGSRWADALRQLAEL